MKGRSVQAEGMNGMAITGAGKHGTKRKTGSTFNQNRAQSWSRGDKFINRLSVQVQN